jgi:phosphatidylglycerol:prolipoprotein diacylglycerol transferase
MFQTLFHIPHADPWLGVPVFGLGWALAVWGVICAIWIALLARKPAGKQELWQSLPLMIIVAIALAVILPQIEEVHNGVPLGVPIRGYGTMLLIAIITGVGLAGYRAQRMGLDPEIIFSLAFAMCLTGVIGARAFYVIQKWDEFAEPDISSTVFKILNFTQGGLVVFGSAIGALAALVVFCRMRKLPILAIADLVAPSMMIGLAIGRIGCLMNGCCYGGYCGVPQLALTFPPEAPVYIDQLVHGELFGARLVVKPGDAQTKSGDKSHIEVAWVEPGSAAEQTGLTVGTVVQMINGYQVENLQDLALVGTELPRHFAENQRKGRETHITLTTPELKSFTWELSSIPPRSLPVHPTQIYSAVDALLLFLVLWFYYPFRRHDGEVVALMLGLHAISRFVLEMIRTDEGGALGTPLTISQLVGVLFLVAALGLFAYIERGPRRSELPLTPAA